MKELRKNKKKVLDKSKVTRNKTVKEILKKQLDLGQITEIEFKQKCAEYDESLIKKAAKVISKETEKEKSKDFDLSKKKDKEKF